MSSGFAADIDGATSAAARPTVISKHFFIFLSSSVVDVLSTWWVAAHSHLRLQAHQL
jgi:hypothetical protein